MADLIAAKTTEDVRRIDAILGQIMEAQAEAKAAQRRWCSETGHNWPELVPLRAAPVAVARRAPARPRGRGRAPGRPAVRSGSRSNSDGAAPDPARAAAGSVAECLLPPAVAAEVQRIFDGIARRCWTSESPPPGSDSDLSRSTSFTCIPLGLGIEVEDDRAAAERAEADGVAVLVGEREVWGRSAGFDHRLDRNRVAHDGSGDGSTTTPVTWDQRRQHAAWPRPRCRPAA